MRRTVKSICLAIALTTVAASLALSQTPARVTAKLPGPGGKALAIPAGPYAPNWASIEKNYQIPEWLLDAKFGIFIHWGLYSVPAHGSEWYAKHMYATQSVIQWHAENFGPQDKFGYKDLIPLFKAEKFDPAQWAELFRKAGAKYVVPVAEHHDGFAMYDSKLTEWCAGKMGPKRDLIGDLAKAVRKEGLKFGVSNHRMENWGFMYPAQGLKTDLFDPKYAAFYGPPQPGRTPESAGFLEEWLARCQELVDKYQPDLFWFDNGINGRNLDSIKLRFAAYYYNQAAKWGKQVTLSTKQDAYLEGSVRDYERGRTIDTRNSFWQNDNSIAHNSWGYNDALNYRKPGEIVRELAECVSKNGALLLNIAPMSDGTIPEEQQQILLAVGKWLSTNGEAIYGTRPWVKFGEGPTQVEARNDRGIVDGMLAAYTGKDIRFTTKGNTLYAIFFDWPGEEAVITSLFNKSFYQGKGKITEITLLGNPGTLSFQQDEAGLKVKMPAEKVGDFAYVLRITGLNLK